MSIVAIVTKRLRTDQVSLFYHVSLFTGKLHLWRDADRSHVVQPFVPSRCDWFLAVDRIGEASVVQSTANNRH